MFRQKFSTVSEFLRTTYQTRGLPTSLFHFILQEQDHELLDECIRILLRSGRWDCRKTSKENYVIPAQFPYQDEQFALALGINQGYKPSTPEYPLCLQFQYGNPLILEIFSILRKNTISTEEEYNALLKTAPIRNSHIKLIKELGTKHHYSRSQIDLLLWADFFCSLLRDPLENLSHWSKIDTQNEAVLNQFSDLFPQFHEVQLAKLTRHRIITSIWSLPHPELFALVSANRANSIVNKTQLLILLESRHLHYLLSFTLILQEHIQYLDRCQRNVDGKFEDGDTGVVFDNWETHFKQFTFPELNESLSISSLLPNNYLQSSNAGSYANPLNGGQLKFDNFEQEMNFCAEKLKLFEEFFILLWKMYSWQDFPTSLQCAILVILQFRSQSLTFLPWVPSITNTPNLFLHFDKYIVDNLPILTYNQTTGERIITEGCPDSPKGPQFVFDYDENIIEKYQNDLTPLILDNRRFIMSVINPEIYGPDLIVIAPQFKDQILNDLNLTSLPLIESRATRTPTEEDREFLMSISSIGGDDDKIDDTEKSGKVEQINHDKSNSNPTANNDGNIDKQTEPKNDDSPATTATTTTTTTTTTTAATSPQSTHTEPPTLDLTPLQIPNTFGLLPLPSPSSSSEDDNEKDKKQTQIIKAKAKSCLPLDEKNRRSKRVVHFNEVIYDTDDKLPMKGTNGDSLQHDHDLKAHEIHTEKFASKLASSALRSSLIFATITNMTNVIDYILDSTGKLLNEIMNDDGIRSKSGMYRDQSGAFENLIAAACHTPHCTPSTIQYLFKRRSKLCTNNKTGRDNNAFLVLYQTEQHWFCRYKYAKLMVLWHQVKTNERVYKPHLDFQEFLIATLNQLYNHSLSFWFFTFVLENLLPIAERQHARTNAIRICDLLSLIYKSPGSSISSSSMIPVSTRLNGPPGAQQGLTRQHCAFPSEMTVGDLELPLPPIINYVRYKKYFDEGLGLENDGKDGIVNTNEHNDVKKNEIVAVDDGENANILDDDVDNINSSQYSTIISPPQEYYFPANTTLRDAYHQYECSLRFVFLQYFINSNSLQFFLPASQETTITEDFPAELFSPSGDIRPADVFTNDNDDGSGGDDNNEDDEPATDADDTDQNKVIESTSAPTSPSIDGSNALPDVQKPSIAFGVGTTANKNNGGKKHTKGTVIADRTQDEQLSLLKDNWGAKSKAMRTPHRNIRLYLQICDSLSDIQDQSTRSYDIINPLTYKINQNNNTNDKIRKNSLLQDSIVSKYIPTTTTGIDNTPHTSPTIPPTQTTKQSSTTTTITTAMSTDSSTASYPSDDKLPTGSKPHLPSFLFTPTPRHLVHPRGNQRDHLHKLMIPFLEFRDLRAIHYLLDLGVSAKSMWHRLLSVQQVFFEIRDLVDFIPEDLYTNRDNYNINGLNASNIIQNNPWLTLGKELDDEIIKMKKNPQIDPNDNSKIILVEPKKSDIKFEKDIKLHHHHHHNNNNNNDDNDEEFINLPPLSDIDELLTKGVSITEMFGANKTNDINTIIVDNVPTQIVFESPNKNPFLTKKFLTTHHISPMLQFLQLFLLYDNSLFESTPASNQGQHNLSTAACLSLNWSIVQALFITNTDTFITHLEVHKYAGAVYCHRQRQRVGDKKSLKINNLDQNNDGEMNGLGIFGKPTEELGNLKYLIDREHYPPHQDVYKEYLYDPELCQYYKHDLIGILSENDNDKINAQNNDKDIQIEKKNNQENNSNEYKPLPKKRPKIDKNLSQSQLLSSIRPHLPPRIYNKLTNPTVAELRKNTLIPSFTPEFHLDSSHLLLMFLLPQFSFNPLVNYSSMLLFELIFSHVLRQYGIFDSTQKEEILNFIRRSFSVHTLFPQTEKGLYDGPIENIVKITIQYARELSLKHQRFKEQIFVNSIKDFYKFYTLFSITKPKQPEFLFFFNQTHLLHPAILFDMFFHFIKNGGDYSKQLTTLNTTFAETYGDRYDTSQYQPLPSPGSPSSSNYLEHEKFNGDKFASIIGQFLKK
jgi:hypothetical protein